MEYTSTLLFRRSFAQKSSQLVVFFIVVALITCNLVVEQHIIFTFMGLVDLFLSVIVWYLISSKRVTLHSAHLLIVSCWIYMFPLILLSGGVDSHFVYLLPQLSAIPCARKLMLSGAGGGEEFLIILADVSPEKSLNIAETIRRNIESLKVTADNTVFTVTATLGCYCAKDSDLTVAKDMVDMADKAMYRGKNAGKNQVMMASDAVQKGVQIQQ